MLTPGLDVDEVDLGPGLRAGFTTVDGGVSPYPWNSLNLGGHVGDAPSRVARNRELLSTWIGAPVVFATQVHGAGVADVAGPPAGGTCGEYDAMVTSVPELALGVLVADCVPVLLADPMARVIAVAHAGRAGITAEVVPATVSALRARGARQIRAVVGPCICAGCYEVPEAMRADMTAQCPAAYASTRWGTPALDLRAAVSAQLRECDVADISQVGDCTREGERRFSHRRAMARTVGPV